MKALRSILFLGIIVFCSSSAVGQCTKDTDCKGDRICVDGECVSPAADQSEALSDQPEKNMVDADVKICRACTQMGAISFYFEPLGFVQFGPIFGIEIGTGSNLMIDAHLRYSAGGLIYRAISTEFEPEQELNPGSMAVGGGIRYFFPRTRSPHRPYLGGFFEYGWESGTGDEGDYDEWTWESRHIVFGADGGFRFRFGNTFYLGLGGSFGVAPEIFDEWEYVNPLLTEESESETDVYPFGMLRLTLGFEFGR